MKKSQLTVRSDSPARIDVPFMDLGRVNSEIEEGFVDDVRRLIGSSSFINGEDVSLFEEEFASSVDAPFCVGVASGLDALRLALQASGIGAGDEVLVPAMTFIATWECVSQVGAVPVPVDVSEDDYCIDLAAARSAVGPRTRAIIPVHLFGQMTDPSGLSALAEESGIVVIEDACQAHGASRDGAGVGTIGSAAAFSFYPGKNLGAFGDGGALVTADEAIAVQVRALREHGQRRKYEHDQIGWTSRLDTLQAAALRRKLPLLADQNAQRRAAAAVYLEALAGMDDLVLPSAVDSDGHVWHLFVVRTSDPVGLADHLRAAGVATGRHYPQPPHLSAAYATLGHPEGAFPVSERFGAECLSLPLFPGISEDELGAVVEGVRGWFTSA